jgi:two-component system sensor histidine kinase and response regulator WspE
LQGTDLLMRIATPTNAPQPSDIEAYVALMAGLLDPSTPPATLAAPPMAELQFQAPPVFEPAPAPVIEAPVEPSEPASRKNKRTTEGGERVLRVTAERLNSLLDLSSKSLVETQRLKPHLATMQRLKRMQNNGLRALENLNVHLKEHALSLEALEALEDARGLLA